MDHGVVIATPLNNIYAAKMGCRFHGKAAIMMRESVKSSYSSWLVTVEAGHLMQ